EEAAGVASRGAAAFTKAQCAKCHKFEGLGDSIGPDLTTISSRFTRKELIESIIHPSHIISSQYASKTIRTMDGRQVTGLVVPGAGGETIVILPNADRVTLSPRQIEATKPRKLSAMPEGPPDPPSLEEVAELF